MEVRMFSNLRSLHIQSRSLFGVNLKRRIRRAVRRTPLRSVLAGLLVTMLLLSSQPWQVWASGSDTLKLPVEAISSHIDSKEIFGPVSDWFKNLKRSITAKP